VSSLSSVSSSSLLPVSLVSRSLVLSVDVGLLVRTYNHLTTLQEKKMRRGGEGLIMFGSQEGERGRTSDFGMGSGLMGRSLYSLDFGYGRFRMCYFGEMGRLGEVWGERDGIAICCALFP
jgi:hypothetical protein